MFAVNTELGRSVLVAKLFDLVRVDDILEGMPIIEKLVAETHPRGLLFDWTELKGWDEEGKSLRFAARLEMRAKFERVAVLADSAWDTEVRRLQEVTDIPVRRFPPVDWQSARAWLESNT
jgi:SpoIIAA-like